jgi:hypothetical protein
MERYQSFDFRTTLFPKEITAVNEHLNEVANGGKSLLGMNALERADTHVASAYRL